MLSRAHDGIGQYEQSIVASIEYAILATMLITSLTTHEPNYTTYSC